jgi:hypothetical protein
VRCVSSRSADDKVGDMRKAKHIKKLLQEIEDLHIEVAFLREDLDLVLDDVRVLQERQESLASKWKHSAFPVVHSYADMATGKLFKQ